MDLEHLDLITMRQFLFLHWLYIRKSSHNHCDLKHTDISCTNCLKQNEICDRGLIPASYFSKKINRQYYDCKRVLDLLETKKFITRIEFKGKGFSVFYEISDLGAKYYLKYCSYYAISLN